MRTWLSVSAMSIVWGGDTTLGSSYGLPPDRGWPQLAHVAPVLRDADLAAVNYEGTFTTGGPSKCAGGRPSCFAFRAPPANAATLARAGVDVVNTANNHAFDFGPPGWRSTRSALRRAGVSATGSPGEVRFLKRHGRRVAFLGFSTYPWSAPMSDHRQVRRLVARAARKAPIVVVFFHAGAEGTGQTAVPYARERAFGEDRGRSRAFAHAAIDAGADLVLGSGPHVLRGMEYYKRRLVAYSLGNLAGWHNFNTSGTSALSALLRVEVARNGAVARARVFSLRLTSAGVPHRDGSGTSSRLMRRLSRRDFGLRSPWSPRGKVGGPPEASLGSAQAPAAGTDHRG
jgi:poly-gamma-glutamate capsule biosynthesis protein CapA/YwtB (metallophosphatase superfamily)